MNCLSRHVGRQPKSGIPAVLDAVGPKPEAGIPKHPTELHVENPRDVGCVIVGSVERYVVTEAIALDAPVLIRYQWGALQR